MVKIPILLPTFDFENTIEEINNATIVRTKKKMIADLTFIAYPPFIK